MARLTACFALSAVLVLATGISSGNGQLLDLIPTDATTGCLQFPSGQLFPSPDLLPLAYKFLGSLPPMRIISRGNTSLSVAADDNGNVVLAKTNCWDARQLWVQHYPILFDKTRFSLVNLGNKGPLLAMPIPEDSSLYPVKLAPYSYSPWLFFMPVPTSMLWTQETPLADGFYKIRSYKVPRLLLDGLYGNVHEGTVVGAYPAGHDDDNILWKIEGFLSNP
ncbi:hypothetical protein BDA96_05G073400 [Sorghum bicolor]|uniref:Uncharacterized protein n=2 Tax=Sorghum bicolor TaxID=4558 RepID=A0A921UEY7_SORBI|nr:uncharacterized protein LOC110435778 [Sorghum bicolor]KAG0529149.1 hypothetical protein BDA96_05G073400 [Sorghum bicolor]KXG27992.1 hypothetical protein SORBI_3005G073000 [Sorghum bicolor]|eukprot:XP_021317494.1 uncharacterized protein LOC110435778 [Sorghum bicolor]